MNYIKVALFTLALSLLIACSGLHAVKRSAFDAPTSECIHAYARDVLKVEWWASAKLTRMGSDYLIYKEPINGHLSESVVIEYPPLCRQ